MPSKPLIWTPPESRPSPTSPPPRGQILVSANDRTLTNVNGRDPMEYRRAVSLLGSRAQVPSADKRASFAGTFIAQNTRPNRQQRQAMASKRGRVRTVTQEDFHRLAGRAR